MDTRVGNGYDEIGYQNHHTIMADQYRLIVSALSGLRYNNMLTIKCGDIVTAFETLPFYELLNVFSGFDIADNVLYLMNERVSYGYVVIEDHCIYINGFAYPYTTARLTPRSKNGEHWVQFDIDNSCTGVNVSFIVLG